LETLLIGNRYLNGFFKLKYTGTTGIPYYENKLQLFMIIDYENIE
jgi:hypothetical protein